MSPESLFSEHLKLNAEDGPSFDLHSIVLFKAEISDAQFTEPKVKSLSPSDICAL